MYVNSVKYRYTEEAVSPTIIIKINTNTIYVHLLKFIIKSVNYEINYHDLNTYEVC